MQIVQARGREIPVTTRSKRYTPERARAEALFHKPAAVAKPRILEDAPKVAATRLVAVEETEHDKVFRLVREGKFEDAARLAARLINVGQVTGFFIYGKSPEFTKASEWHQRLVRDEMLAPMCISFRQNERRSYSCTTSATAALMPPTLPLLCEISQPIALI